MAGKYIIYFLVKTDSPYVVHSFANPVMYWILLREHSNGSFMQM